MDCAGRASADGVPSFVVGSGGNRLSGFGSPQPASVVRNATGYGVLRLDLTSTSWSWPSIASGRGWNGSTSVSTGRRGRVLDRGTQSLGGSTSGKVDVRAAAGADDAEQRIGASTTTVGSDDLDLGLDGNAQQVVGVRFAGVRIPEAPGSPKPTSGSSPTRCARAARGTGSPTSACWSRRW